MAYTIVGEEFKQGELITQEQKARELGISYRTLSRWIRQGRLTFVKLPKNHRKFFMTGKTENLTKHKRYRKEQNGN